MCTNRMYDKRMIVVWNAYIVQDRNISFSSNNDSPIIIFKGVLLLFCTLFLLNDDSGNVADDLLQWRKYEPDILRKFLIASLLYFRCSKLFLLLPLFWNRDFLTFNRFKFVAFTMITLDIIICNQENYIQIKLKNVCLYVLEIKISSFKCL